MENVIEPNSSDVLESLKYMADHGGFWQSVTFEGNNIWYIGHINSRTHAYDEIGFSQQSLRLFLESHNQLPNDVVHEALIHMSNNGGEWGIGPGREWSIVSFGTQKRLGFNQEDLMYFLSHVKHPVAH